MLLQSKHTIFSTIYIYTLRMTLPRSLDSRVYCNAFIEKPDAFPESDLELQKKIKKYQLDSSKWLPWRSYVAILLFSL